MVAELASRFVAGPGMFGTVHAMALSPTHVVRVPSLRFFAGPMGAGKSTLALQTEFNYRSAGRDGMLLSMLDRSGLPQVTSRLGMASPATDVTGTDLFALLDQKLQPGDFVVADEAQFYSVEQIDQLACAVDELGVDVDCFGLLTDFRSKMFPGSRRLLELADSFTRLQLDVLCWCGRPGSQNARVVDGVVVHEGDQVVVGDTDDASSIRYTVLCRRHWRARQTTDVTDAG
jgi:thymidine kinase